MSGRAGAGRSQRPSEGSGRVLSGRLTVHMMSDVHGISGVLNKEQGLRGANSGERQVGLKAGFTPAVPQPCHLPSASKRGRGEGRVPRRGTSVPPREFHSISTASTKAVLTPASPPTAVPAPAPADIVRTPQDTEPAIVLVPFTLSVHVPGQ